MKAAAKAKSAACAQLRTLVEDHMPPHLRSGPDDDAAVTVNELSCSEPGCPPVETVVSVLRKPAPLMFKVFKPAVDVTEAELLEALGGAAAALRVRGGAPDSSALEGVYDFVHSGGSFQVHLRPGGKFFCQKFQVAKGTWTLDGATLKIDFVKFGKYELTAEGADGKAWAGSAAGNPSNWRKMALSRPFSAAERALMDSEWDFVHPGGSFKVEFRADGYNHFVCSDFPAHSHWRLDNGETPTPLLYINWGKYGEYDLTLAADGQSMAGSAKGAPDNWRKGNRLGSTLGRQEVHEHDH